jgi:hypothetical protein
VSVFPFPLATIRAVLPFYIQEVDVRGLVRECSDLRVVVGLERPYLVRGLALGPSLQQECNLGLLTRATSMHQGRITVLNKESMCSPYVD